MSDERGYYDIDIAEAADLDSAFYLEDLKQRKLFINDEVDSTCVEKIVKHILQFNKEDEYIEINNRRPILLYINTHGGDISSGFELIDVIQSSKTPVFTINIGMWLSAGAIIGMSGHKRFSLKNSVVLIHDGSFWVDNTTSKAIDVAKFQERVHARIRDYVINNSKITKDEYDANSRFEWYMFAEEAKDKGIIDYIIGEDCEIDAIV